MRSHAKKKNTHLLVLAAIAAFVALLLFLDAFVPVIPDGRERPDSEETIEETVEETKQHWWEKLFGRDEGDEPVETDEDGVLIETDGDDLPLPTPSVGSFYTEDEMIEAYIAPLEKALTNITHMEAQGEIPSVTQVGLFNIDVYGIPEVIVQHVLDSGQVEYTAYELYSLEPLVTWSSMGQNDELSVWVHNGTDFTVLFAHDGNGDDEYVYELESTDRIRYMELTAKIRDGSTLTYRCEGKKTSENTYLAAVNSMESTYSMMDKTALRTTTWHSDTDPEKLAKIILTSGQKFLKTDDTEP